MDVILEFNHKTTLSSVSQFHYMCISEMLQWVSLCQVEPFKLIAWLMEPGGQYPIHKDSPIFAIPIIPKPHIHIYFFKIHSNILRLGLPKSFFPVHLPVKILKVFLTSSILVRRIAHFNILDILSWTKLYVRYKIWSSSLCLSVCDVCEQTFRSVWGC